MTHPISPLGLFHTVISMIPLIAGIYCFVHYKMIDPITRFGKIYLIGLVLAVITSFGVSSTGGLNAGHVFGIVVLLVAFGGVFAAKLAFFGKLRPYLSAFGLSFSFLLSLVPATNETLTRIPPWHPLAEAPMNPLVLHTMLVWFRLFVVGFIAQCFVISSRNKRESTHISS